MEFYGNSVGSCLASNQSSCSGVLNLSSSGPTIDYTRLFLVVGFMVFSLYFVKKNKGRRFVNLASIVLLGLIVPTCTCDFVIVQSMITLAMGNLSSSVVSISIIAAIILTFTFFFGRYYCGWVCPLGALQELVNRYDFLKIRWLNRIKYLILLALIPLTLSHIYLSGPTVNWEKFSNSVVLYSTILLIVVSIFVQRPWCNYLCPFGALLGIVNRFSLSHVVFDGRCKGCNLCGDRCKSNAIVKGKIDQYECINCGECIGSCPLHSLKRR